MMQFDLLDRLRRLERADKRFCFSTHPSDLEWQLNTELGVRLLALHRNDLAAPRTEVLFFALQSHLARLGVVVEVAFPATAALFRDDVRVKARFGGGTLSVGSASPALALLEVALAVLEGERSLPNELTVGFDLPPSPPEAGTAARSATPAQRAVQVRCTNRPLRETLERLLKPHPDRASPLPTLFVDSSGHRAVHLLEGTANDTVVVTDNPCQEYWLDVLALEPSGFLAGDVGPAQIVEACEAVARGERVRHHPPCDSPLWPKERAVVRLLAEGLEPEEIAARLRIGPAVVRNYVASSTMKLRLGRGLKLSTRIQLANYYWGNMLKADAMASASL
jgi:DNA-binding NarL/FixJ family response regulator